jgi:hypothetical protein
MALLLEDIIGSLLNEGIDSESVLDAIQNKYYVRISYDDGKDDPRGVGDPKGSRLIQPMAIGTTKKGFPVVRAFQLNGNSRKGAPNWKFFRLDRIKTWRPMKNKRFAAPPDESFGVYNRVGDKSMGSFTDNAKFDDMDSPLAAARARRQNIVNAPKMSVKNAQGPITANQQWKKNVYTSQPNSQRYKDIAKNIDNSRYTLDKWADYEKALQQAQEQDAERKSGPINQQQYDEYDDYFDEDDFQDNYNTRRNF